MRTALLMLLVAMTASVAVEPSAAGSVEVAAGSAASPSTAVATIPGVIAAGSKAELVGDGFHGTEGAIAMPDGSLLFCEIDTNRIIHLDLAGTFSTYLEDTNRAIGLAFDPKGHLIAAQSRDPRIAVLAPHRATLADSFEGQPLVRPNDLIIDKQGGIYFTDPIPSPQMQFRDPPPGRKPLLFYITPAGHLIQLTEALAKPNGVQLSTTEKILYAVDGDHIVAFDVQPNGSIKNPRKFADVTGDGLAVDSADRLYVATEEGIRVFSAKGRPLGSIPTPVRIQSIAFAGVDRKTLYAVGRGKVFRIPLLAAGIEGRAK
jgi:gluconolactonase